MFLLKAHNEPPNAIPPRLNLRPVRSDTVPRAPPLSPPSSSAAPARRPASRRPRRGRPPSRHTSPAGPRRSRPPAPLRSDTPSRPARGGRAAPASRHARRPVPDADRSATTYSMTTRHCATCDTHSPPASAMRYIGRRSWRIHRYDQVVGPFKDAISHPSPCAARARPRCLDLDPVEDAVPPDGVAAEPGPLGVRLTNLQMVAQTRKRRVYRAKILDRRRFTVSLGGECGDLAQIGARACAQIDDHSAACAPRRSAMMSSIVVSTIGEANPSSIAASNRSRCSR